MVDAASIATQLANWQVSSFETRAETKLSELTSKRSALSSINTKLSSFKTLLSSLTGYNKSVVKSAAVSSDEEVLKATADASAQAGNYKIFVEQLAQNHQLSTQLTTGITQKSAVTASGTITFQLGDSSKLDPDDYDTTEEYDEAVAAMSFDIDLDALRAKQSDGELSYYDLVKGINSDSANPGIAASIVQTDGGMHLLFTSEESGAENNIQISSSSNDTTFNSLFNSSGMQEIVKNQDAIAWLGGENSGIKLQNASNDFEDVISGVDFTLTDTHSSGDTPLSLTISSDAAATKKVLDEFATKYNAIMTEIAKYSKTGNSEEGVSRGVLAADSTTRSIKNSLRAVFQQSFNGVTPSELGFEFDRYGKLSFDSDTFEDFQSTSTVDLEDLFSGDDMLISQLKSKLNVYSDSSTGTIKSQLESIDLQKARQNDKLEALETKYEMYYARYLKQYTALNTMQTQIDNVTSLFSQY